MILFWAARLLVFAQQHQPCSLQDDRVERFIRSHVRRQVGHEYCQYRRYAIGDLDRDGKDDLVVLYGIEGAGGGNHVEFYMAIFETSRGFRPVWTQVGARGERGYSEVFIEEDRVRVKFDVTAPGDAICCPTGTSTSFYTLAGSKLVEHPVSEENDERDEESHRQR